MTTLLEDLQAALTACVPIGKAWPIVNTSEAPATELVGSETVVAPYIVWQRIVSTDNVNLQGPSNVQNTHLQVDIFAPRLADAEAVREAVDAALLALAPTTRVISLTSQDLYEESVKLYRIVREFSVWR